MQDYFNKLLNQVDAALLEGVTPSNGILEEAIHYALSVKGKRLRPLLFLILLNAFDKEAINHMDIACAIEYIHTYSLIHDDLPEMDNDPLRRGMPTVHVKFNEAIALLAGDTLLTMAFERISFATLPPKSLVNIIQTLTVSIGKNGMAGGQALDLEFKGNKEGIFNIHRLKTAKLISATFLIAGEITGLSSNQIKILEDAGLAIGLAFQMADDLLDLEGDETEVGKKLQKDKNNQSPNSVLYYGKEFIVEEIQKLYAQSLAMLNQLNIINPYLNELMEKMVYRKK